MPGTSEVPRVDLTGDAYGVRLADDAADALRAHLAGDRAAMDRLVHLLSPLLWHISRAYGLSTTSAEDVVQTTWLTLVRKADSISDPQAVLRWLTVTTRREAWRVAREVSRADLSDDDGLLDRCDRAAGPEQVVLQSASDRALWRAVHQLSERCQRLLRVVAFSDRPDYVSLSADLGMPVGSIGPTRGRCLSKLHDLLTSDPEWSRA